MPNLLLHQGDNRVERSDVKSAHTPSSTRTWQPIAHDKLLETVEDSLSRKGFYITNESHGLSHNGDRYFGLLEIRSSDENQDYRSVVGVRNSHDKRFPAGVVLGSCVLVCCNLAFSGEVSLARKHTRFILRDLPWLVNNAISSLLLLRHEEQERIERYKQKQLTDLQAHDALVRSVDSGVIAPSRIPKVLQEWRTPSHDEFTANGKSAWRLFNAFTESWKGSNLHSLPGRSHRLQQLFDGVCQGNRTPVNTQETLAA